MFDVVQGKVPILIEIKEFKHFNVETHYNDDFIEEDKKIKEFISNDDQSGLIILHGGKGTGKTTYIRSLILSNPDKKFVFVPSNLIPMLGDPSFANFLLTMTNHIIVLEDCEDAIRSRKVAGNGAAVSLLLNMSDGLMSDDLCMKFICTFNEDIKNIEKYTREKNYPAYSHITSKQDIDKKGLRTFFFSLLLMESCSLNAPSVITTNQYCVLGLESLTLFSLL